MPPGVVHPPSLWTTLLAFVFSATASMNKRREEGEGSPHVHTVQEHTEGWVHPSASTLSSALGRGGSRVMTASK